MPDVGEMERRQEASVTCDRSLDPDDDDSVEVTARRAIHAETISIAVRALVEDALIATRRAGPETIAARRPGWYEPGRKERRPDGGPPLCPARSGSWPGKRACVRSGS